MSRTRPNNRLERELTKRRNLEYELHHKKEALKATNTRIKRLEGECELVVTNHALIRYFERVKGFNIQDVKNIILADSVKELYSKLGNGKFPNDNFHVVIENGVVKTVI